MTGNGVYRGEHADEIAHIVDIDERGTRERREQHQDEKDGARRR